MDEEDITATFRETWEQTPLISIVPSADFRLLYQENRVLILKALNAGISEPDYHYTRHILTAQEILDFIQKNHNEEFKLTNVYFHLQKLQEKGMIREVTQMGTGKRPKTYYGRTAKIFLDTEDMGYDLENDEFFQKVFMIVSKLHPELNESEIKKPFYDLNSFKWENIQKLLNNWFTEHKEILSSVDIDNTKLYVYLARLLDYFNEEYISLNKKVCDVFKIRNSP